MVVAAEKLPERKRLILFFSLIFDPAGFSPNREAAKRSSDPFFTLRYYLTRWANDSSSLINHLVFRTLPALSIFSEISP